MLYDSFRLYEYLMVLLRTESQYKGTNDLALTLCNGTAPLSITTLSIITFSIITHSIMTFSIPTLSIMAFSILVNKMRHTA